MPTRQHFFCLACLIAVMFVGSVAQADVIFGWLTSPTTTVGGGARSTRSGFGTWQLYATDTYPYDFGISSYNVTMANVTAIDHRSPVTTVTDENGDPYPAGFSSLRTAANVNPIQASQDLSGQNRFAITGFGQTTGNFASKIHAIDPVAQILGPTTSGTWNTYDNIRLYVPFGNQYKWIFLAEGLYDNAGPRPSIVSAEATVFVREFGGTSAPAATRIVDLSSIILPEPATLSLVGLTMIAGLCTLRRRHA